MSGGYDDGYARCSCFWGTEAGSLVKKFLSRGYPIGGLRVLDLGCGEGKNAHAFAQHGAHVVAVDSSEDAIKNGRRAFSDTNISWIIADAGDYLNECKTFDIIVMYGLLHCLPTPECIAKTISCALSKTEQDGYHIVAAFNDGPHDLSAHPNFVPTLVPHQFFLKQYIGNEIEFETQNMIHEAHPHNDIEHFHSLTRLIVRRR